MLKTITLVEFLIACVAVGISIAVATDIATRAAMERCGVPPRWRKPISILMQTLSATAVIYLAVAL